MTIRWVSYRSTFYAVALCMTVVACGEGPDDWAAACREAGISDGATIEKCKESAGVKDAFILEFTAQREKKEREGSAKRSREREAELMRKEQEDMARRKAECLKLIAAFATVAPVSEEARAKAAEQFELAEMERDESYFGKCIDYANYAINLAKGQ